MQESWRAKLERLGIEFQEPWGRVEVLIEGRVAATIQADNRRSGAGGYVFRHVVRYPGAAYVDLANDLSHAADIVAFKYGYTSQRPAEYAR